MSAVHHAWFCIGAAFSIYVRLQTAAHGFSIENEGLQPVVYLLDLEFQALEI